MALPLRSREERVEARAADGRALFPGAALCGLAVVPGRACRSPVLLWPPLRADNNARGTQRVGCASRCCARRRPQAPMSERTRSLVFERFCTSLQSTAAHRTPPHMCFHSHTTHAHARACTHTERPRAERPHDTPLHTAHRTGRRRVGAGRHVVARLHRPPESPGAHARH